MLKTLMVLFLSCQLYATNIPWSRLPTSEYAKVRQFAEKEIESLEPTLLEFTLESFEVSDNGMTSSQLGKLFLQKACWGECDFYYDPNTQLELQPYTGTMPLELSDRHASIVRTSQAFKQALKEMGHTPTEFVKFYFSDGAQSQENGFLLFLNSSSSGVKPAWIVKVSILETK